MGGGRGTGGRTDDVEGKGTEDTKQAGAKERGLRRKWSPFLWRVPSRRRGGGGGGRDR